MAPRRLQVPPDAPPRLDAFLVKALPGFSKEQVRRLLAEGKVKVDGKKAKPLRRIVGGETVELDTGPAKPLPAVPKGPPLPVLVERDGVVIIDKPSGVAVEHELLARLAAQLGSFDVGGQALPGVAHRLDKDTSGCLAFARSDKALGALLQAFDDKRVTKTYLALVHGVAPEAGTLDTPYGRHPEDPRRYTTRFSSPRRARLSWKRLEAFAEASLLEIDLDTGRTHQIRAQLADVGHPLLGDWLYGTAAAKAAGFGRIALHAARLRVEGLGARPLTAEAPLPDDFARAVDRLRATSA